MTRKTNLSKWAETAFQFESELWRAKTTEGMVVLGKLLDGIFTLLRFNDEGGRVTHISESEALWLTLELVPEKMDCIGDNFYSQMSVLAFSFFDGVIMAIASFRYFPNPVDEFYKRNQE